MQTAAALQAINFEQLATATDRLLLLGFTKAEPTSHASSPALPAAAHDADAGASLLAHAKDPWRSFTLASLCTALFAVTASIVSLL